MTLPKRNTSSPSTALGAASNTGWGNVADWYDAHIASGTSYHETLVLPHLRRLVGNIKGKRLLDVACGTGFFSKAFADTGADVTGIDISPELIVIAKASVPKAHFFSLPAHKLVELPDSFFDIAINILAIDNIAEAAEMLKECARVLRPGGIVHVVLNHPAFRIPRASSWVWDQKRGLQSRQLDAYMSESKVKISMNPGGGGMTTTTTFHRSLGWYFEAFKNAGFAVSALEEWISNKKSGVGPRQKSEDTARKEFPLFLYVTLKKC